MKFLTDFADQAVILPMLVLVAACLAWLREWRTAAAWVLIVAGVLGTVLVLKIVFYACGWLVPLFGSDRWNIHSPSGHVASAAVLYGGIVALCIGLPQRRDRPLRMLAALVGAAVVSAVIGFTRVVLGAHSLAEVVLAALIGSAGALFFAGVIAPPRPGRARWLPALAVLVVWVLFHGLNLPAEAAIRNVLGERLRDWVASCQGAGG